MNERGGRTLPTGANAQCMLSSAKPESMANAAGVAVNKHWSSSAELESSMDAAMRGAPRSEMSSAAASRSPSA
jgi:hypothetical protein